MNRIDKRAAKAGLRNAKKRKEAQQRRAQERPSALHAHGAPSAQPEAMRFYLNSTTWTERCVPHLDDPELRRILHRDFGLFVISHYGALKGHRMPGDFETRVNKVRPP